ncbi:MAG: LamG domain-containing protein, partial [Nanoarchaeota archaeon]|nr:LamG domain-containing protein [Nanoarchaeota archaeon]
MKRDRNIIAIFVILFSFFLVNNLVDAKISISDDISYVLGEKIKGNIYLELDDNDFVPMDSELVVSLAGQEKKLRLFEVLEIDSAEGNFYVENFNISGSGQGYEKPKDKIIYPEVYFKLLLKEGAEIPSKESVSPEIGEACTPSISCGEWGDCINSYQTRLCISMNKECIESNINEERECFIEEEIEETVEEEIVDVEEVVEGEEIEEVEGEVVEGEVEEIETEEVEEEITEDPIKDPIPEELLDITFDLEENSLNSADKLIVWISLQSFGKNYIPARLVYIIEDVNKIEIYREFEEIRIYSEVSIIKKFEGLSLDSGDYTLIFHVEYSGIVEEFRSKFTIKTGVFNLIGSWVKELFGLNYVPFLEVTGKVVDDLSTNGPVSSTETEIEGIVSKDTPFTYNLGKRNSIEIIDGSIRTDSINLSDNDINLDIEGREIIITTQYFEEKDLEDEYFLKIPLEKFDIIAKTGTLGVKLIYQDISLIELSKDIKGEEVSEVIDDSLEPETNESLDEIKVVNETSDVTLEEGVEDVVSVNVIQYKAVLNRPVKWISEIDGENIGDIKIPIEANDIRVGTEDDVQKFLDEILEYEDLVEGIDRKDILDESLTGIVDEDIWNDKNIAEKITYSISNLPSRVGLTNGVASGGEVEEHISIVDNDKIIEVDKIVDTTVSKKVLIEYYTDAPLSKEIIISNFKKKIIISGPDIHYDNILAYTELSKESESSKIRLYHLISGGREEVEIVKYDLNENGLIDYIEWVVPSLSSQTYELEIEITKAEHLDSNRNLISDIYEEVKSLDGVWSEVIPSQDFVRVTFEQNLTSSNDITIYARKISGKPSIEVYEIGGTDVIAEFSSLVDNEYNKVLLNNLVGIQDTFDLKIIGGGIEFDHIIDPATENLFDDCLNLDKWNNPSGGWVIAQGKCRNANTKGSIESLILLNSIDLTGVDWAEFSFDMDNAGLESGDYLRVYVNSSIESWQLLLDTNSNAAEFHSFNIANSITMTTGFHVRFETLSNANNDKISIDNINITSFVSDIPVLDMTIVFPENKTYGSIAIPLNFNVTLNANGSVHYSLDGGVTNISMTGDEGNAFGTVFNAINTSISDGFYTFQAYGNDTSGSNNYFESVSFSIDATAPSVSFVPPTSNGSQSNNNIYVNFSTISSRNHYSFVNFDNDLLLWLRMDEVSGNTVIDLSGESNNGVIVGDAHQIQDGRFGAAFDFDGIPDGDSTDAINLSGFQTKYPGVFNESFTAVAWIKANKVAKMAPFGTKGITNWPGWHFRTGGTNRVKFGVNTGYDDVSGTSASVETTDPIIANTWIHMVGIYDQTVPSISLYLNGILIGTRTANVSSTGYANDQWLAVASQEDPTKVWDGQIDEVMIFKRALTSSEVGSLYDATATQYEHNFTGLGNNGSYTFTGYAVDVLGNKNEIERTVTISEGGGGPVDPTLSFVLTPSNSEDYLIVTTATGGSCPSELTCNLYRDGVAVTNGETVTLSAGTYNYDYNTTGNVNYTNGSVGDILTVNQISPVGSLTNSTLWTVNYGTLITVGLVESNTGDSDLTYIIYRDGISVGTGESVILSAGTYNYVLNTSGGTNYSANSAMDFETLVVSPIASSTSLSFDVSSPQDFGVAITPSCSVVSGDGSAVLTMDGSVISSGVAITPGAGDLTFNCSLGASQNYTSSENVSVYTVSPISSVVNLTLNSTSEDIIIFQGDSINLGCSVVTGDSLATVELYREGWLIDSGVSSVINLTTFNIVQVENITCSYVDSGNYTTSFETFFVNVTPVPDTTPPFFTTIPLDANINYGEVLSVDFDATDNVLFDSFLINWSDTFSINSAGLLVNVSPLSGGSYSINVSINDSSGNVNWTIYSVVVNPISPGLSFALTPTNSEDYLIVTTATGSGCPSQLSCDLYRDGSIVTNGESVTLSAGTYNYVYNTTGNVNYTSGFANDTLTVNPVSPVGQLTNSTLWTVNYGNLITVGLSESNSGDSDVVYTVYRDSLNIGTGESVTLSAGTYNYILNTSGGVNYSANSNMDSQTL